MIQDRDSSPEAPDSQPSPRPAARSGKSDGAFRTISEVSIDLDVPQHVLRFWESKFTQIKPLKRGGGRRYYRPEDVQLLSQIRDLLYKDGYTIRGVQKLLREPAASRVKAAPVKSEAPAPSPDAVMLSEPAIPPAPIEIAEQLRQMVAELRDLRRILADARRQ